MVNGFSKKGLPLLKPSRVIKARYKLVRIFTVLTIGIYFVSGVPVRAIETTKASAFVLEDAQTPSPLSLTKKSPHLSTKNKADPCLSLLHSAHLSPGANKQGSPHVGRPQAFQSDKQAASVALGLFLGVRIALGPKEVVKRSQRVQIGPEVRAISTGDTDLSPRSSSPALMIAAYRSCKNNHALKRAKNNNN